MGVVVSITKDWLGSYPIEEKWNKKKEKQKEGRRGEARKFDIV